MTTPAESFSQATFTHKLKSDAVSLMIQLHYPDGSLDYYHHVIQNPKAVLDIEVKDGLFNVTERIEEGK